MTAPIEHRHVADAAAGGQAARRPRVVTFGETMALFRGTTIGSLAHIPELAIGFGGAESNVAIGLARLGILTTWIGRVGADSLGERIGRELLAERIDARTIVDPSAPTGLMVREYRTADAANVYFYRAGSAGSRLAPADLADADLPGATLLHVSGITPGLSSSAEATVRAAIETASAAHVPISFDINHRSKVWRDRDPGPLYRQLAAASTIVFGGEDEARILAPDAQTPAELAEAISALGPTQVIIKRGDDGCFAHVDGEEYEERAIPIHPVDTVGAGDAFVAGYLAELLLGAPIATRLKTAVTTGAMACLTPGDWEGYARRDELGLLSATEPVSR